MTDSRNMRPTFSTFDFLDQGNRDAILGSYHFMRSRIDANRNNLFRIQFCPSVARSNMTAAAPFGNAVSDVVVIGAKEEVVRIDTGRHVAPMQNVHTNWDLSSEYLPRYSVRYSIDDSAIPFGNRRPKPNPAAALWNTFRTFLQHSTKIIRRVFAHDTSNKVIDIFAGESVCWHQRRFETLVPARRLYA